MRLNPALLATDAPPIPEARRWLEGLEFSADRPLLNVSQAAPVDPPPPELRAAIADFALNDDASHLYGPVLGLPDLRAAVAREWSDAYDGRITPEEVAITPGCNQAFVAVMTALAGTGDEVILPTPWYFNHKMHLDMTGVTAVPLRTGGDLVPRADDAKALITTRTRAIVLVTPNNPTGVEYPAKTLADFRELARQTGLTLVVDETYRDFDSREGAPHGLFSEDWQDGFVHLYSFSKTYRLTGHRVGAIVASQPFLRQIEKVQDTGVICPNQLGQRAALWGVENLRDWKERERREILARRTAIGAHFGDIEGWEMRGLGAYFAFVTHPFDAPADEVARELVREAAILALPATMFAPPDDPICRTGLRIAFANIDVAGLATLSERLKDFRL